MKKFFYPLLLLMAMTFAFTSCEGDDLVVPNLSINTPVLNQDGFAEVAQGDTLALQATVTNTEHCLYHWSLDGKKVFEGPTYKFVSTEPGNHVISLKATSVYGGTATVEIKVLVYGKYKNGTFVLNEGNPSSGNGCLTFISPKGEVTDSAYYRVNGSFLGSASEDLYIANDKIYIISQNGNAAGGDGMLVVANAATLKKEAAYNKELSDLSWPTHIAVIGNLAYIRDNAGVHTFNTVSGECEFVEGTKGAAKNRMAVIGNKVFAFAGDKMLVMENGQLVNTVEVGPQISGLLKSDDNNLWVSCNVKKGKLMKVNAADYTIMQTNEITEGGLNAGWGATPAISAKGDTIYFSNNSTIIYRHIFSQNQTQAMTDVKEHIADANMIYNNLAVHPETGDVYFTTIKGFGLDYLINDVSVFNFDKGSAPVADYKNVTAFPAGVFFTASF